MAPLNRLYEYIVGPTPHMTAATDEVFPLYFLDNAATLKVIIMCPTMRFNEVLDPEKLRDGLIKLIGHEDWRKLGGRLRQRPDGYLEIHVPKEFTAERPAIKFSTESFSTRLEDHSAGKQLPEAAESPFIYPGPDTFADFVAAGNGPTSLSEFLLSDHPILRLHVVTFTDATIVTLAWPHAVFGALGMKNLFSAWSEALKDESTIPKFLGARKDILDGVGTDKDPQVPYVLEQSKMKGWGFAKFASRTLWAIFWTPNPDVRGIFLPREFVSKLRRASMKELETVAEGETDTFLSEGDVLGAWFSRFVSKARGGTRPAIVFNALDVIGRLSVPHEGEGVYVQNLAGALFTTVDVEMLLKKPLGQLAYFLRSSIQEQVSEEQVRAQLREIRQLGHESTAFLYGDPDGHLVVFTNWLKFKLLDSFDFSPAIVQPAPKSHSGSSPPPGKPAYMHGHSWSDNKFMRDGFCLAGKDFEGNVWMSAFLYTEDWELFERYMRETEERIKDA